MERKPEEQRARRQTRQTSTARRTRARKTSRQTLSYHERRLSRGRVRGIVDGSAGARGAEVGGGDVTRTAFYLLGGENRRFSAWGSN